MAGIGMNEDEILETFKLFDQEGSGIKCKDIGTVMRSLGVGAKEKQLKEFITQASQKGSFVSFPDFMEYVKKAQSALTDDSAVNKEAIQGMQVGILRFFEKMSQKKNS